MASPNEAFSEMVTTTLRRHRSETADNISRNNALLTRLMQKGRYEEAEGGLEIVEALDYAENSNFQRYSAYDEFTVKPTEVISAARYDWKQCCVNVMASGLELRQNSGKYQLIKLADAKLTNALRTFKNHLSIDLYSDGTKDSGKQIGGLQAIIADSGKGKVGGIDASSNRFWQNKVQSAKKPMQGGAGITVSKDTIKHLMNPLYLDLSRGNNHPDLVVASNDYFSYYWESLQDLQRYASDSMADSGFQSLKYVGADVVHDGGSGIPDKHMYFLNTEFLKMVVHKDANFTKLDQKVSFNQDSVVVPILWMGNLVCSNRAVQGVITE